VVLSLKDGMAASQLGEPFADGLVKLHRRPGEDDIIRIEDAYQRS
jgi:hypothetical protein